MTTSSGLALISGHLETPPMHVLDGGGGVFKTELVLIRAPERTEKLLWWYADDPRDEPHNHPWEFTSQILAGGYTDNRFWIDNIGRMREEFCQVREGDENHVPIDVYHNVLNVLPGTRTRMVCGEATPGNAWGYLNIETGAHSPFDDPAFVTEPPFMEQLWAVNPNMRPSRG